MRSEPGAVATGQWFHDQGGNDLMGFTRPEFLAIPAGLSIRHGPIKLIVLLAFTVCA
jgi:hypothetical protein